ncbi:4-hydroxy-tetrahydrodipicolinate synthase [Cryptosporangium sp. NPDC051539]|uniref:4-hydroxy-tetrahydrodipicolinate synthase n=1 Tax=Cryptosporangium sp. NPDC051539 TaxID=3363962 RepID=UPI0037AAB40A
MSADPRRPFGRVLTAMVTPFAADGSLDLKGAQKVAEHLVDVGGNDGLIVNGTTGEAPTMTDAEKESVLRAVIEAVGDRATIVAGAGNNDTHHSIELVRTAEKAGADGVLIVSPYYNKPPQAGLVRHVRTLADASDLPVMLYDIPHRTGVAFATETLIELAQHPRVVAVKDAKGDLAASAEVLAGSDLAYYSGDDVLTLPLLSIGAVGVVSVTGHLVARRIREMIDAFERGDVATATALHHAMLPVDVGVFRTQAAILTKAAYNILGLPGGSVRSPLVDATPEQIETLRADLARGGVELGKEAA